MNILYCGDSNVERGFVMSAMSLAMNTEQPLHIFVLTMQWNEADRHFDMLSKDCVERIEAFLKTKNAHSSAKHIILPDEYKEMIYGANTKTRFTPYCMLRLWADELEEIPDRVLYLDTDVICRGDIAPLYNSEFDGCEIAGVLDYYGSWFFRKKWYRRDYVNSGVLLMNMKLIRENGMFKKCRNLCRNEEMFLPDQTAINRTAKKKKYLPRKYNEQRKQQDDTLVRHFSTTFRLLPLLHTVTVKPWDIERMHSVLGTYEYDGLYKMMCTFFEKE